MPFFFKKKPKHQRMQHKAKPTGLGLLRAGAILSAEDNFASFSTPAQRATTRQGTPGLCHQVLSPAWPLSQPVPPAGMGPECQKQVGWGEEGFVRRNATLSPAPPSALGHRTTCGMAGTAMQSPAWPLQTQAACARGCLAHWHRPPALNAQGASGWRLLVQSSKCLLFARRKDQTPLTMASSVHPFQTQPWGVTSQSTAGTRACCLEPSSSSDSAVAGCRGEALALPARRAVVPPAEPTYLQVVESETAFPSLLFPVLDA